MLEITEGYWQRAGLLRARLLARGRRARLADSLIAQSRVAVAIQASRAAANDVAGLPRA